MTPIGVGRNVQVLRRIARKARVNIVYATSWYRVASHPHYIKQRTVEELSEMLVREIRDGIEGTNIRAGLIGEMACSNPCPWHPDEKKAFEAACVAQKKTGVAFTIHPCLYDLDKKRRPLVAETYLDFVEKEGADMS